MGKSVFKKRLDEIHKLAEKMPKTLNETIHFTENGEENPYDEEESFPEHAENDSFEETHEEPSAENMNPAGKELVDKIRKVSLQGMADLAETPNAPEYEILKKIWQTCDKALIEKKEDKEIK